MTDQHTTARPRSKAKPPQAIDAKLRARIEAAVERMIAALDAIDAPGEDLEHEGNDEPSEDDEPSLGWTEQEARWNKHPSTDLFSLDGEIGLGAPGLWSPGSQEFSEAGFGCRDDREMQEDNEPSLGSITAMDQSNWAIGGTDEREDEHDGSEPDEDGEPTLGWTVDGNCGPAVWGCPEGEAGEPTGPELDRRRAAYRARRDQRHEADVTTLNGSDCVRLGVRDLRRVGIGRNPRGNVRAL
jgi:hypothetical protein